MPDHTAMTTLTVVSTRAEADLIVGLLRDNDLTAAVSADDSGGQYPALQGVRVLVAPEDEPEARELLDAAADGTL